MRIRDPSRGRLLLAGVNIKRNRENLISQVGRILKSIGACRDATSSTALRTMNLSDLQK
jgi:hypothetical protein